MNQNKYVSPDAENTWTSIRRVLDEFIQAHGTSGEMPTSIELRRAGREDIDQAVLQLGGYPHVASHCGLTLTSTRKPANYWKNFAHVEQELLDFIAEYGTPGVMPIKAELFKAGRGDLAKAITKTHGGIEVIAEQLGLQLPAYKRKKHGYWENFDNVTSQLQNFIAEHGVQIGRAHV